MRKFKISFICALLITGLTSIYAETVMETVYKNISPEEKISLDEWAKAYGKTGDEYVTYWLELNEKKPEKVVEKVKSLLVDRKKFSKTAKDLDSFFKQKKLEIVYPDLLLEVIEVNLKDEYLVNFVSSLLKSPQTLLFLSLEKEGGKTYLVHVISLVKEKEKSLSSVFDAFVGELFNISDQFFELDKRKLRAKMGVTLDIQNDEKELRERLKNLLSLGNELMKNGAKLSNASKKKLAEKLLHKAVQAWVQEKFPNIKLKGVDVKGAPVFEPPVIISPPLEVKKQPERAEQKVQKLPEKKEVKTSLEEPKKGQEPEIIKEIRKFIQMVREKAKNREVRGPNRTLNILGKTLNRWRIISSKEAEKSRDWRTKTNKWVKDIMYRFKIAVDAFKLDKKFEGEKFKKDLDILNELKKKLEDWEKTKKAGSAATAA